MPVASQIAVLLALTATLFDTVSLDRIVDAERALQDAAAAIPADVAARFDTAVQLTDADRETIVQIARTSLDAFQAKPASDNPALGHEA